MIFFSSIFILFDLSEMSGWDTDF